MTDRQSLQALADLLQQQVDQARNLQNGIKRLQNAKKEPEVTTQRKALLQGLQSFNLQELGSNVQQTQADLEQVLGEHEKPLSPKVDKEETKTAVNPSSRDKRIFPGSEDQENAYHLKARMMPRYQSNNKVLEAELLIRNRRNDLRAQRSQRQVSYNRETNLSAATTLHVIHMYEKKARAEEVRANALQAEVDELREANEDKPQSKSANENSSQNLLGRGSRVNDIIRKNEHLVDVLKDQNLEIQRLRRDNGELIRKAKHATEDRHQVMVQLSTSEKAKRDLYSRFHKQKSQHDRLNRSLTRQSADWIESRKQQEQLEEEIRWRSVGHAAPHGSFQRTHSHPVQRNVDQPRNMYPVENYAQPLATS